MKLYTYFRSTAAYRVRIALNYKGIRYDSIPVHLLRGGGEHNRAEYLTKNPDGLVPALDVGTDVLAQSLAIIEYIEETTPNPALLPCTAVDRAYVRGLAQSIACDIHPLNNLRVQQYLKNQLNIDSEHVQAWYEHWVTTGFSSIEQRLAKHPSTGRCCFGDSPSLADLCLIPQVYNAVRFNCAMDDFPTILRINDYCLSLPAFQAASVQQQPDAV
jgi:maleylacetoacetate isomerase/maleylpyruvate isomerase